MKSGIQPRMNAVEWLMLIVLSMIWGGSFFFNKVAVSELPVFTVLTGRLTLAAMILMGITCLTGHRLPRSLRTWGAFIFMGVLNNLIPFALILWGQTTIASGLASILNAATPLFTVILAHFLTRDERLTFNKVVGVLIGLAGVTVMIGPGVLSGFDLNVLAELAVIAAAVCYALSGIYGRRFRELPPLVTATGQVTGGAVVLVLIAIVCPVSLVDQSPSWTAVGAVLGLSLFCTVLAFLLYFRILASAGATNAVLVTLLIPVSAMILGAAFLGETLEFNNLAGMALIALGLIAIDGRMIARLYWAGAGTRPGKQ